MESQHSGKPSTFLPFPLFKKGVSVGNYVLPPVIVKCFGVFGNRSLVLLETAVGSAGCMDGGGASCSCACVFGLY